MSSLFSAFFPEFLYRPGVSGIHTEDSTKKKKKNQGNLIVERNLQQAKESIGMKFTMAQSVQPRKDETEVVPFSYSHTYG